METLEIIAITAAALAFGWGNTQNSSCEEMGMETCAGGECAYSCGCAPEPGPSE